MAGLWAYWAQDLLDLVPFGILVASPCVISLVGNAFSRLGERIGRRVAVEWEVRER